MSVVSIRILRRGWRWPDAARVFALALTAVVDGALISQGRFKYALIFSVLPVALLLFGRTRAVFLYVLMPGIVATLMFGHSFALIRVGPAYALDAIFFVVVLLALPAVIAAIGAKPGFAAIAAAFVLLTFLHAYQAGLTRVALRQSVIGMYVVWAILGVAVARSGVLDTFMRLVYLGAAACVPILARGDLHDVGHDLYITFGLALVLLAPAKLGKRRWVYAIVVVQLAVLALGHVRSIWVALPLALVATLFVCGMTRRFRAQLLRILFVAIAVLVVGATVRPATFGKLQADASSVFSYSGQSVADNNAKWRLGNWHYGISQIRQHPLQGIGFGGPEVPPSVCTTGCNNLNSNPDPTVLAGSDLHNSILAVPLRMGLPALLILIIFEAIVLTHARRYRTSPTMQWLLTCHLLTGFTALTAVVLEGPYMGIFFWLFAGLVVGYRSDSDESAPLPSGVAPALGVGSS